MRRSRKSCAMVVMAFAILGGLFTVPRVHAQSWDNGGIGSNWANPTNWSTGAEPTAAAAAIIGYDRYDANAYAVVTETGEVAKSLFMGRVDNNPSTGTLVIASGDLTVGEMLLGYSTGGTGNIIQSNGIVNQTSSGKFRLGSAPGSVGTYVLEGGTLNVQGAGVAHLGDGTLELRGGTIDLNSNDISVGNPAGVVGKLFVEAGVTFTNRKNVFIGQYGIGTWTQNGGTHVINTSYVAHGGGTGTYQVVGGTLQFNGLLILHNGTARFEQTNGTTVIMTDDFRFGNSDASTSDALYTMRGGTLECRDHLDMPYLLSARSELRGWGTVTVTNTRNFNLRGANAFVRADGFGADHELDLNYTLFPDVDPNDPTTRNGWYAVNHGKLTLPDVSVTADTVYWGEDTSASDPNRANSVELVFTGRTDTGALNGSLLAPDHGTVPPFMADKNLVAGVWKFELSGTTFEIADLTFRYDPQKVAELGLEESEIEVYRHTGAPDDTWTRLSGPTRDAANNRITATTDAELNFFAVGKLVPPQGTLFLVR